MYLSFSIGEEEYFLTEIGADTKIGEFRFYKMFDVRPMQPKERVLAKLLLHGIYLCGIVTISSAADVGKNWFTAKCSGCLQCPSLREHGVSEDRTGSHRGSHARR